MSISGLTLKASFLTKSMHAGLFYNFRKNSGPSIPVFEHFRVLYTPSQLIGIISDTPQALQPRQKPPLDHGIESLQARWLHL